MGHFAKAEKQAASVVKALQRADAVRSFGTARIYTSALTNVADYAKSARMSLRDMTPERAQAYLEQRAVEVGQKQLDSERQALQSMMQHVTNGLKHNERLETVKSAQEQTLSSRSYTPTQVALIAAHQAPQNALATEIAYRAGLRAHELLTLEKAAVRAPNDRPARDEKFLHREGERYTVIGKGGLIREVQIPKPLAERLEARRLETPERMTDRGIHYAQHYALGGGQRWSNSFSRASERELNWSAGAHGLRHSYAQERIHELQMSLSRREALEVVSQEMGHFRSEITEIYLR